MYAYYNVTEKTQILAESLEGGSSKNGQITNLWRGTVDANLPNKSNLE